ncbi:MAG: NUDIX hydrolase [Gaiellaceae bacterium]
MPRLSRSERTLLSAAAVVLDDTGRVLLVHHAYGLRRWSLPGGAIEPGETPREAVLRETLEETGVR